MGSLGHQCNRSKLYVYHRSWHHCGRECRICIYLHNSRTGQSSSNTCISSHKTRCRAPRKPLCRAQVPHKHMDRTKDLASSLCSRIAKPGRSLPYRRSRASRTTSRDNMRNCARQIQSNRWSRYRLRWPRGPLCHSLIQSLYLQRVGWSLPWSLVPRWFAMKDGVSSAFQLVKFPVCKQDSRGIRM